MRQPIALKGRLVDASCVFDDAHALLSCVWSAAAAPITTAYGSSTPHGQLLAHGEAPGRGRALLAGRVVCATDEGLLSLRNDNGALVPGTLFPDTQPFVGADDTLLAQPDGSLIVASNNEIIQLSLSP